MMAIRHLSLLLFTKDPHRDDHEQSEDYLKKATRYFSQKVFLNQRQLSRLANQGFRDIDKVITNIELSEDERISLYFEDIFCMRAIITIVCASVHGYKIDSPYMNKVQKKAQESFKKPAIVDAFVQYVKEKVPELRKIDGKTHDVNVRELFAKLATEKSDIDSEIIYGQIKQMRELYMLGNLMKQAKNREDLKTPVKPKATYHTEHDDKEIMNEAAAAANRYDNNDYDEEEQLDEPLTERKLINNEEEFGPEEDKAKRKKSARKAVTSQTDKSTPADNDNLLHVEDNKSKKQASRKDTSFDSVAFSEADHPERNEVLSHEEDDF